MTAAETGQPAPPYVPGHGPLKGRTAVVTAAGGGHSSYLTGEVVSVSSRYALQTMCEGGGQANVTIIERL